MQSQLHQTPSRRPASFRELLPSSPQSGRIKGRHPPPPGHAVFASSTSAKSLARDSPGGIYCGPRFHTTSVFFCLPARLKPGPAFEAQGPAVHGFSMVTWVWISSLPHKQGVAGRDQLSEPLQSRMNPTSAAPFVEP